MQYEDLYPFLVIVVAGCRFRSGDLFVIYAIIIRRMSTKIGKNAISRFRFVPTEAE